MLKVEHIDKTILFLAFNPSLRGKKQRFLINNSNINFNLTGLTVAYETKRLCLETTSSRILYYYFLCIFLTNKNRLKPEKQ